RSRDYDDGPGAAVEGLACNDRGCRARAVTPGAGGGAPHRPRRSGTNSIRLSDRGSPCRRPAARCVIAWENPRGVQAEACGIEQIHQRCGDARSHRSFWRPYEPALDAILRERSAASTASSSDDTLAGSRISAADRFGERAAPACWPRRLGQPPPLCEELTRNLTI